MDKELLLGDPPELDPHKFNRDCEKVEQGFWPKVRRLAKRVPFLRDLLAAYYCAMDPASPLEVKAVLMGALAYFVLPLDVVPDFLAFFGFADDAAVLYGAVKLVARHVKPEHRAKADTAIAKLDS